MVTGLLRSRKTLSQAIPLASHPAPAPSLSMLIVNRHFTATTYHSPLITHHLSLTTYHSPLKMNLLKFVLIALAAMLASSLFFPLAAQSPVEALGGNWNVTLRHNDLGVMRSTLYFRFSNEKNFKASSHRKAVKNLLGGFKAGMAKCFSQKTMLVSGAFINLTEGKANGTENKVLFTGTLDIVVSPAFQCQGTLENGRLVIPLQNSKGKNIGVVEGIRSDSLAPIDAYPVVVKELLATYETRIYDRKVLATKEWKVFAKKMTEAGNNAKDDLDLVFAFFTHSKKLPFTHKSLFRTERPNAGAAQIKQRFAFRSGQVSLEEKTAETVVLRIKSFHCPGRDVDSVMQIVLAKNYQNLIVDIRGNSGGSLEGGMTLAQYLVPEETPTGVYLTQKWFNTHPAPPTATELAAMPAFGKADVLEFLQELDEQGFVVLKARPGPQRFTGKVFLLTDRRSASACEPLAWNLKNSGRVTMVGEHTAGAMLSASSYPLRSGFTAVIPNADYYTPDGNRLDRVGVQPNIKVKGEDALEYVLEGLSKGISFK